jgi:hypothetical protein
VSWRMPFLLVEDRAMEPFYRSGKEIALIRS